MNSIKSNCLLSLKHVKPIRSVTARQFFSSSRCSAQLLFDAGSESFEKFDTEPNKIGQIKELRKISNLMERSDNLQSEMDFLESRTNKWIKDTSELKEIPTYLLGSFYTGIISHWYYYGLIPSISIQSPMAQNITYAMFLIGIGSSIGFLSLSSLHIKRAVSEPRRKSIFLELKQTKIEIDQQIESLSK